MFGKKQLKELSHICAYCGTALKDEYKTLDHVIPQCAGGKGYANNIVICCSACNKAKANQDINTFLDASEERINHFYNYLNLIDNQRGNKNYSEQILKKISSSPYHFEIRPKKKRKKSKKSEKYIQLQQQKEQRKLRLLEPQNIEYRIHGTDIKFKINETQRKILEFYISNPEFTDYKVLAQHFDISIAEVLNHIVQMNNLTGLFVLKHVSKNGIKMNELFYQYLNVEQDNSDLMQYKNQKLQDELDNLINIKETS